MREFPLIWFFVSDNNDAKVERYKQPTHEKSDKKKHFHGAITAQPHPTYSTATDCTAEQ